MKKQPYKDIDLLIDESNTLYYKNQIIEPYINQAGYLEINIPDIDFKKTLHRIVAKAYIPTNDFRKDIHHKDGNKLNNSVDNLEWLSRAEHVSKHSQEASKGFYIKLFTDNLNFPEIRGKQLTTFFYLIKNCEYTTNIIDFRTGYNPLLDFLKINTEKQLFDILRGLKNKNIIRKIKQKVYLLNPNICYKGSIETHNKVIKQYKQQEVK